MKQHIFIFVLLAQILCAYPQKDTVQFQKKIDSIESIHQHIYELGDYKTSLNLHEKAYKIESAYLPKNHPNILRRLAVLAIENAQIQNTLAARGYIEKALQHIAKNPRKYDSIYCTLKFANGRVFQAEKKNELAAKEYDFYLKNSKKNQNLKFSALHNDHLLTIAYFYRLLNFDKWGYYAKMAYSNCKKPKFNNDLIKLKSLMHLAFYHFVFNQYEIDGESLRYIKLAKALSKKITKKSPADAIKAARYNRQFILWQVIAEYTDNKDPSVDSLANWAQETRKAIESLVEEKKILKSSKDVSINFIGAVDYFDFSKKLYWQHYRKTNSAKSIDTLLSLHESFLYNKIRNRLNTKKIDFNDIPTQVSERENHLLQNLFLKPEPSTNYSIKDWNGFLDTLKVNYPKYHGLKYGKVIQSIGDIQKKIPQQTTLIRYFYIYNRLHAFICSADEKSVVQLPYIDLGLYLDKYSKSTDIDTKLTLLHILYEKLWQPFAEKVQTNDVIIVPDQNLFNLSFELLTSKKVDSYEKIANHSLMAKHTISYNYSIYLVEEDKKIVDFKNDFIAYAPEFSKKMKRDYHLTITDSLQLDKSYLTLLQQPFSTRLVSDIGKRYSGDFFLNEKASKQVFFETAKEHKIIHISTHAEANNETPELSRLVFAKNVTNPLIINNNHLYTFEIYNYNLSSELAILTACETGKPTFQPGEGMISLAHAFNYAGSKSILTSLWEIDEQSSTQIVGFFYDFLEEGLPKDEALKRAKFKYLDTAPKEALAPEYWAGLVLMGDTAPILMSNSPSIWKWYVLLPILILIVYVFKRFKAKIL